MKCENCGCEFEPTRPTQRFHNDACRRAWHRKGGLPGKVAGIYQLANGSWSIVVHYTQSPSVRRGMACRVEAD